VSLTTFAAHDEHLRRAKAIRSVDKVFCLVEIIIYRVSMTISRLPVSQQPAVFVAKLDASGHGLWSKSYASTPVGGGTDAIVESLAVDGTGSVYVTGNLSGAPDFGGGVLGPAFSQNTFLLKLDAGGHHVWSKALGPAGASLAVDPLGDLVLCGTSGSPPVDLGGGPLPGMFVGKLDASGNHLWSKSFAYTGSMPDYPVGACIAVATDASGAILLTGAQNYPFGSATVDFGGGPLPLDPEGDVFVAKLTSAGAYVFATLDGGEPGNGGTGQAIAADAAGNIVVTGLFTNALTFRGAPVTTSPFGRLRGVPGQARAGWLVHVDERLRPKHPSSKHAGARPRPLRHARRNGHVRR
jgi:hypothetical protein